MKADVLVIGPHPDDAELGVGGLIAKLVRANRRVVLLDLTRGERASRGTVEQRAQEAQAAAQVLGLALRECAGLPDGGLQDTPEQRLRVLHYIRKHQPAVLLAPMAPDRHPDHGAAHALAAAANFDAGLQQVQDEFPPYRAERIFYYYPYSESAEAPPLVVDISDHMDQKLEALRQYRSQFYNPAFEGAETMIATPEFWENLRIRAAYWGARIGTRYGEPLFAPLPMQADRLFASLGDPHNA